VESVKAASDVYAPVSGEVVEINAALTDAPELVNKDPYGDGWIMRIQPADTDQVNALMDSEAYNTHAEQEEH
jgi:glycine cleavage system H protein